MSIFYLDPRLDAEQSEAHRWAVPGLNLDYMTQKRNSYCCKRNIIVVNGFRNNYLPINI